jgi:proteic killer suppression protein
VIKSFRRRGLKALYEDRGTAHISPALVPKLQRILAALDRSSGPEGMDLPGFRLHPLKGPLRGHDAVWVSGNWRVTFRFAEGHAVEVDYCDYH